MPKELLDRLEEAKTRFGPGEEDRVAKLLAAVKRLRLSDAASLIRLHEILLFLRAYPHGPRSLRAAEHLLAAFSRRVAAIEDRTPFEEPEVSGIAGTSLAAVFSHSIAGWLAGRHGRAVRVAWDRYEDRGRLAIALPRLIPLMTEETAVEPDIAYDHWLRAAGADRLAWLVRHLEPGEYDALGLPIEWQLGDSRATRTLMRLPARRIFYHHGPLIRRAEVSLEAELEGPPLPIERLSRAEGERILAASRDASAVRYRELHGFTHGDPARVLRAGAGRGLDIYLWGVAPQRRLPLRAYHAAFLVKNGVPVGYFEGLSLFERMEAGFNLYYTFRDGESAWLYARALRLFRQVLGVTCFVVDPYQIGKHNEEAIASGAFWFYRKLGFRPVEAEPARLLEIEERRLAATQGYRTPPATLRRLAAGPLIYAPNRDWDRFHTHHLALAAASKGLASLMPAEVRRAKHSADEARYLGLLQRLPRLRAAWLRLGGRQARQSV